jgi:4-hydroxy-2-oxovalerate aldolase
MNKAEILDCTLRDGSYILNYNFNQFETTLISKLLFNSGINYVEVGHGVGIGANKKNSNSFCTDEKYIESASSVKKNKNSKVGSFCFSSLTSLDQIYSAKESGLDFIRFGVNPKYYKNDLKYIKFSKRLGLEVFVNFIKSYSYNEKYLSKICNNLVKEGIDGAYIVDSAGGMLPDEVMNYVYEIKKTVKKNIFVGFHGHNNLGLANANCLSAIKAGANIVDTSLMGMGRSSGNAITEMLVPILQREKILKNKINLSMIFDLVKKVISPIYKKNKYDENEILIGKSFFHSSYFPKLVSLGKKLKVSPKFILQNISFKNNLDLNKKFEERIIKKIKNKNKVKRSNHDNDKGDIEYINFKSFNGIKDLKKILIAESFKKDCHVALTICRSKKSILEIKNIYTSENIILGHIESPDYKSDNEIISNFSKYFIFFDENININKINKKFKKKIFYYSEQKIFKESVNDFVIFSRYNKILTNNKNFENFGKKNNLKNKKNCLFVLDSYLKNSEKELKKVKNNYDLLIISPLKYDAYYMRKKFPLINNIYKPNYGINLCFEINKKINMMQHIEKNIGYKKLNKNTKIISGGQVAEKNSIVVNSIKFPTKIIGISDGKGGITENQFNEETKNLINKWFLTKIIN